MSREIYQALKVDKKLTLVQWMVGFNLAVSLAALWKLIG